MPTHSTRFRRQAGFTLGELMIGLVILSVLSMLFAWGGYSSIRSFRQRQILRDIAGWIQVARARSLQRTRFYAAVLTPNEPANPNLRGRIQLLEGSSASLSTAFSLPNNQTPIAIYDLRKQSSSAGMIALFFDNETAPTTNMQLFFSPRGTLCRTNGLLGATPGPGPDCTPTSVLLCFHSDVSAFLANASPETTRGVLFLPSGQTRFVVDEPRCRINNQTP